MWNKGLNLWFLPNFVCVFVLSSRAIYCSFFCCCWHTLKVKKWKPITYFHPNNLLHLINKILLLFLRKYSQNAKARSRL